MSTELLVKTCAPTLAGIKTANLFSFKCRRPEAIEDARNLNRMFCGKGLRAIPVKSAGGTVLLYVYRPDALERDLEDPQARGILKKYGYPDKGVEYKLTYMLKRLRTEKEFPHEIGLFLGYPPEDVRGFIEKKGLGCKCSGYWKVYGDREKAQKCFRRYDKCRRVYAECYKKGASLSKLTVSTAPA